MANRQFHNWKKSQMIEALILNDHKSKIWSTPFLPTPLFQIGRIVLPRTLQRFLPRFSCGSLKKREKRLKCHPLKIITHSSNVQQKNTYKLTNNSTIHSPNKVANVGLDRSVLAGRFGHWRWKVANHERKARGPLMKFFSPLSVLLLHLLLPDRVGPKERVRRRMNGRTES